MKIDQAFDVRIPPFGLAGTLTLPENARGLVVFAHGSGSSRFSIRNIAVAQGLNERGFATLLFDLLTQQEEHDRSNVFNTGMLGKRLVAAIDWLQGLKPAIAGLPVGLFGASTGAAAALVAAAQLPHRIAAVVSRGGRPDLAGEALSHVHAPTLLIVGGADSGVIELNEEALARLGGPTELEIVPGATHLFPEPGAMNTVIDHASQWFERYLRTPAPVPTSS
ncbi:MULTISPECIES: dienelactone hydrolase family protein [unclassified Bradyrhizobium]|uniref:dienelactone hydrolase family protein n=1 Tax=unclassified Bradyrhizobium TaxID=2631580 RepID=UPI0028E9F7EB|nr:MULTISPECIES: alpha/beta fold hydrolase [unclassified Bradyrhizobium]